LKDIGGEELHIEYDPKYDIMNVEFIAEGDIAESTRKTKGLCPLRYWTLRREYVERN
jgi:hypothetical protein